MPVCDQRFGWTLRKPVIAASVAQHKSLFFLFLVVCVTHPCLPSPVVPIFFCMHFLSSFFFNFFFAFLGLGGFSYRNNY